MANVYVLYTGGTIGCVGSPLAPMPGPQFQKLVSSIPGLANGRVTDYLGLQYTIDWFEETLDSSNMTPSDWIRIAQNIVGNYPNYDGFVILHGTDTMSFTASALSFLLPGLSKPVIFTGAQLPLSFTLNDALSNLVGAIVLAGTMNVPKSCLYFDSVLLRGNRSVKVNASRFAAFESPNYPALATVGTEITVNTQCLLSPPTPTTSLTNPANLHAVEQQLGQLAQNVLSFSIVSLVLYPGIQDSTIQGILTQTQPRIRGMVIQAFGEGNSPSSPAFLQVLKNANANGVVLMDNTQVLMGSVNINAYTTGSGLAQAGALSAYDMTPEASLAKLVYLFGMSLASDNVKKHMQQSLAGELTMPSAVATSSSVPR